MSTKQSVIFTFMVLFTGVLLYSLGAWFYYGTELDARKKTLEYMNQQEVDMKAVLDGTATEKGLKKVIEDPVDGLKKQLENAVQQAENMAARADKGAESRRVLYEAKGEEIEPKFNAAKAKWKQVYEDWDKQNKDISAAQDRFGKQQVEKETRVVAAQTELTTQLTSETADRERIGNERKERGQQLTDVRSEHEDTLQKIAAVTREARKARDVSPQGKIVFAAEDLKTVTINIGNQHGLRRGMLFDVYSGAHNMLIKKGSIEITAVKEASATAMILPPKGVVKVDEATGWVAPDARMRYSVYSGEGDDETKARELVTPKSRAERIEALRQDRIAGEIGLEKNEGKADSGVPQGTTPTIDLGRGFVPIIVGDWIHNPDYVAILPDAAYEKQSTSELLSMQDVNIGSLTFYLSDIVKTYRREYLKRFIEKNNCKVVDAMTPDVNYVVSTPDTLTSAMLEEKLRGTKDKNTPEVNNLRKTKEAVDEARKIGAQTIPEDEMEAFFTRRERKMELLRGKRVQPGQNVFYVAGETRDRSVDQVKRYIEEHKGVIANSLDSKVDYVVVGAGLDKAFYDNITKLGLKILREDELPKFFGKE